MSSERLEEGGEKMKHGQLYTEKESEYILQNYDELGPERIAQDLGRTTRGVVSKRERLLSEAEIRIDRDNRIQAFYVAMNIIKGRNIKHENAVAGALEAVRAGWLDDIEIKIV
jgi:hypothetical protein